ncbi:MAG: pyruvate ferredoxin oxidoreductase [Gammaproteobacteria bacterium]|nr:pyruvate ferredoxin oxidoreductase [Gammaproteobacteria bacterium]
MNNNSQHEIRFHGRGGQGAVSAAALLSLAAFEDGFNAQAFPKFGSERRGAPVEAYVRISSSPIRSHNQIYNPDVVIIQDSTLVHSEPVLEGLKDDGLVILNSDHLAEQRNNYSSGALWITVNANQISEELLGRPLPNTVLLGALAASTGWVSLAALEKAISHHLVKKGETIVTANINALREGYRIAEQQEEAIS